MSSFAIVEEPDWHCPDDASEVASTIGTAKTDDSNVTSRTDVSLRMKRGFAFILKHKGTKNARAVLDLLHAKPLDKAKENELSVQDLAQEKGAWVSSIPRNGSPLAETPTKLASSA